MTIGIMQPYFLPYIGYFQLINAVDAFVIYDNIKFSKGGWVQRNRYLMNGEDKLFTLPIKKDSDFLDIIDRRLAEDYIETNKKTLRKIFAAYKDAPQFARVFPLVEKCFLFDSNNLFHFLYNSIKTILSFLEIQTRIIISSELQIPESLKFNQRIYAICKKLDAKHYINPIGGVELYDKHEFNEEGLSISFLKTGKITYPQFNNDFIGSLSIIDVLMFNEVSKIKEFLTKFELV